MDEEIKKNEVEETVEPEKEEQEVGQEFDQETPEQEPAVDTEQFKDTITENTKKINYSAALKEKNRKIQQLKTEMEQMKQRLEEAEKEKEEAFNLGLTPDVEDLKKEIDTLKQQIAKSEEERRKEKEQQERIRAKAQLDNLLASLKKKYPDFDEAKVLTETYKRKGENATPADIELVYLAMKAEALEKSKKLDKATTEGTSQQQAVGKKKYKSVEEAIADALGEPLE
jgi:outer membrane murein-binding lipoprotein Lpp